MFVGYDSSASSPEGTFRMMQSFEQNLIKTYEQGNTDKVLSADKILRNLLVVVVARNVARVQQIEFLWSKENFNKKTFIILLNELVCKNELIHYFYSK